MLVIKAEKVIKIKSTEEMKTGVYFVARR